MIDGNNAFFFFLFFSSRDAMVDKSSQEDGIHRSVREQERMQSILSTWSLEILLYDHNCTDGDDNEDEDVDWQG